MQITLAKMVLVQMAIAKIAHAKTLVVQTLAAHVVHAKIAQEARKKAQALINVTVVIK